MKVAKMVLIFGDVEYNILDFKYRYHSDDSVPGGPIIQGTRCIVDIKMKVNEEAISLMNMMFAQHKLPVENRLVPYDPSFINGKIQVVDGESGFIEEVIFEDGFICEFQIGRVSSLIPLIAIISIDAGRMSVIAGCAS